MAHIIDMRTPSQDSYAATYRYDGDQIVCTLVDYHQDLESQVDIDPTVYPLTGWPTDGMRAVAGDDGVLAGEYIGCTAEGYIDPLTDGLYSAVMGEDVIGYGRTEEECREAAAHSIRTAPLYDPETGDVPVYTIFRIDGLEEVRYYRASDGCVSEDFEAASMEEAIAMARESWESATEGTYDVTVCEHLTEEERDEMYRAGATRPTATETITVVAK